jgi:alanine racemase
VPPRESRVGDWVELFGTEIGIDKVAAAAGTISYEILTRLGKRLHRDYRD